ncbi:MAG: trypsin-like peptidase domain-containing protein [Candidatus Pelagibacter sp.]|nr:trypsin-like peptidase domain-containing protein [Candidatus Pelagibacter sp.]
MAKASKDIIQKHEQMFYPTVRVRTKRSGGSGTVVYSKEHKGEFHTYVITNHHVVSDSVKVEKKWDPVLKRKVDKEILDTVYVEFFRYNNYSHTVGSFAVEADIVAYSEVDGGQDWALLRVRDKENKADWVANLFPLDDIENIHIFDKVFAVGASLGHPPVASEGHISYMDDEIEHFKYWMSSAPTIFGNSGGAVYRWSNARKRYDYIGIPSRISIQPMGFSADAITHMGYFIPLDRIYTLLEDNDYQFIYDDSISIDECERNRKEIQSPEKEDDE